MYSNAFKKIFTCSGQILSIQDNNFVKVSPYDFEVGFKNKVLIDDIYLEIDNILNYLTDHPDVYLIFK